VKKRAARTSLVARPVADRYHRTVIPLGGGIAIFATIMIFVIAGLAGMKLLFVPGRFSGLVQQAGIVPADFLERRNLIQLGVMLLAVTALFALGLCDDLKGLGPFFKLAVQFAVAITAAAFAEIRVHFFIHNVVITSVLSAFWIVLIINAFNFLDNMDGLSAGIAAIACAILFTAAAMSGQIFVGGLALLFVGSLCGFLVFNFPPAKIFMGDAGSMVVGFFVAVLTLRTTYYKQTLSGPLYPVFMPLVVAPSSATRSTSRTGSEDAA